MFLLRPLLNASEENCVNATICFIKAAKVPVTRDTIESRLKEHPDYPSLLSVSDCLREWKVDNLSVKIEGAKIADMPLPFIAQVLKENETFFVTVKEIANGWVTLSDATMPTWKKTPLPEFQTQFNGTVLVAQTSEVSGEPDFRKKQRRQMRKKLTRSLAIFFVLSVWLWTCIGNYQLNGAASLFASALLTCKLAGLYISGLLIWYEIDRYNPSLQEVCQATQKINCTAILESRASKIGDLVSWAEVGFFYFSGGMLLLIMSQLSPFSLLFLACLNIAALPYTIFSIYYQWKKAKQWCVLCLAVQGILIAECVVAIAGGMFRWDNLPYLNFFAVAAASYALPALAWLLVKPLLQKAKSYRSATTKLARFKFNTRVFDGLLRQQKPIQNQPENIGILIGRPDAKHRIVKVCNPYCGPSAKTHPFLEALLETNDDVSLRIIYTTDNTEKDRGYLPVRHFMALAEKAQGKDLQKALQDWYNMPEKNYAAYASKYKLNGELQEQGDKLSAMKEWCNKENIMFTPTVYINGRQLPNEYHVKDLAYFLAEQ